MLISYTITILYILEQTIVFFYIVKSIIQLGNVFGLIYALKQNKKYLILIFEFKKKSYRRHCINKDKSIKIVIRINSGYGYWHMHKDRQFPVLGK